MKAVIIAAGCGSRLKDEHKGIPKTLMKINGKRIIDDIIGKVHSSGINDFVIVTGYESTVLEKGLGNYANSEIHIQFVHNPEWKKANGISVLAARHALSRNDQFILLMSDHIFSTKMLKQVINTEISKDEALLALDFKIESIPDLDDGMKIQCSEINHPIYLIKKFGKLLQNYQAIDCGMFKMNYNFFAELEISVENGNCSLSDACNAMAIKNKIKGFDIGENLWFDIDTPEVFNVVGVQKILLNNQQ